MIIKARLQEKARVKVNIRWLVGVTAKGKRPKRLEVNIKKKIVKKRGKYLTALAPACCLIIFKIK